MMKNMITAMAGSTQQVCNKAEKNMSSLRKVLFSKTGAIALLGALIVPALSSCMEDTLPTDGVTQSQVEANATSKALVNAVTKFLNTPSNSSNYSDCGYPTMMIRRDIMTADMPVRDPAYYYFQQYAYCHTLGNYQTMSDQWSLYNKLVLMCNLVIRSTDPTAVDEATNLATAYMYRAFAEMDMARMYEFRPTGTSLDNGIEDIKGLTVPIVNENKTEADAYHNPRAPFYKMYRYILHDLDMAEELVQLGGDGANKNMASISAVYGLKARLWLEIATRFDRFPEDMAEAISHEGERYDSKDDLGEGYALNPLGVNSAVEAYAKAADYAKRAQTGHSLLTEAEWSSPTQGFNTATTSSWMLAILMGSSDEMGSTYSWQSWVGYMCPEASWGVSNATYKASHCIDKSLYDCITPGDWRRYTWVGPGDIDSDTFDYYYASHTSLTYDDWSNHSAYVGIKFHPASGDTSTYQNGNLVSIPLMRVEEMYFIEAEARAKAEGVAAGAAVLQTIMASRTNDAYQVNSTSIDGFIKELITQKRIEFWGEGLSYFDHRRLGYAITRGYTGTNHPESYRFNSIEGYVAPWTNIFIPLRESQLNSSCKLNPDPSTITETLLWNGK